jgi:uncharacterized protein (TIGR03437 family)
VRQLARALAIVLALPTVVLAQNLGFVVSHTSNEIKLLNLSQRQIIGSIPTGLMPAEMLILPDNRTAFVTNPESDSVSVVDIEARTSWQIEQVGDLPGSLIGSPDGRSVYIALEGSNEVKVLREWTSEGVSSLARIPVGASPVQVNLSPGGRFLYVVNRDDNSVSVIDTSSLAVVKTLAVGSQPVQFALSPTLQTAFVVNSGSDSVSVVDLATNEITGEISVGSGPSGVAFSTNGQFLYVINRDSNNISVVDTTQSAVIAQMPVGSQPVDMVVTFDSRYGFVSNRGSNSVTLLDLATRTRELDINVGIEPFDLHLDPNEDFLYVTNLTSQTVSVLDINTDRVVSTISIGGLPIQFTQYNSPTLLELAPNPAAAGSTLILNGESLLPSATVRFVTSAPPRTVTVTPTWLDGQGLQVTVPSMQGSNAVVSVAHPDGNSSEQITLRFGSTTTAIAAGGVVEGAGFQPAPSPISGGAIVSVFGSFPGAMQAHAGSFPLPAALGNARVTFNGSPAPLLFSSSGQMNLVAPLLLFARDNARVAVTVGNQTSRIEPVPVAPYSPGLFQIPETGLGAFAHGSRSAARVTVSDPALRGETLIFFVTGLGETFPSTFDGEPAPGSPVASAINEVKLSVGGVNVLPAFAGLAPDFSGLYQINFVVPSNAPTGDEVPVTVTIGARTSNTVRLAVR